MRISAYRINVRGFTGILTSKLADLYCRYTGRMSFGQPKGYPLGSLSPPSWQNSDLSQTSWRWRICLIEQLALRLLSFTFTPVVCIVLHGTLLHCKVPYRNFTRGCRVEWLKPHARTQFALFFHQKPDCRRRRLSFAAQVAKTGSVYDDDILLGP